MSIRFDEKDIEDWLYENPEQVNFPTRTVKKWIARQYHVPSGIIDLLGYMGDRDGNPHFCVVEVKNVKIDPEALTQVCRYANDIQNILYLFNKQPVVFKAVVSPEVIDKKTKFEADALNVNCFSFHAELILELKDTKWTADFSAELDAKYETLKSDFEKYYPAEDVFEKFISTIPDSEGE